MLKNSNPQKYGLIREISKIMFRIFKRIFLQPLAWTLIQFLSFALWNDFMTVHLSNIDNADNQRIYSILRYKNDTNCNYFKNSE
jgi:hypothetical protein